VYVLKVHKLLRYVNWTKDFSLLNRAFLNYAKWTRGNPTHDIRLVRKVKIGTRLDGADTAIVLSQNEETGRALWEIGYMLENMFLQAKSLDISYQSKLFNSEEISQLAEVGIRKAAAAVCL